MKAKVARTYGWTDKEISSMPAKVFNQYWIAITPIEADEMIRGMKVAVYPHLKASNAKKLFNEVKRQVKQYINFSDGKLSNYEDALSKVKGFMSRGRK